jgi:transposase-like protein
MKFESENILEFADKFNDDKVCLAYLSDLKWSDGFKCTKCGHDKHTIRKKNLARDCNKCHHIESPTVDTLFHRIRFGLRKAFGIVFEMSATSKGLSSLQVAKRYSISPTTAWTFMHKVRKAMDSSGQHPMEGEVHVDEFVYGGRENLKQGRSYNTKKKKLIVAVELTDKGTVKRVYFNKIKDYSSKSLRVIFDKHISEQAEIKTDKWAGYKPIGKDYNITQELSENGSSMQQLHTIIHQVKSWLRSTYSWMHKEHIESYLAEYSFRINRSIYKQTIFHKLIERMVKAKPYSYQDIIVST